MRVESCGSNAIDQTRLLGSLISFVSTRFQRLPASVDIKMPPSVSSELDMRISSGFVGLIRILL
jgi:hypothetical protein